MAEAIGGVLSFAVGVAISPVPIVAVVLMLATPLGRRNGPAFVAGWCGGLALVGAGVLLLSGGVDARDNGEPAAWVGWLKLVLGAAAIFVGVRQWRGRTGEARTPGWMSAIDTFTPPRAAAFAIGLAAVNPKNLLLTVGAAATIAQTGAAAGTQAVALGVFVVLAAIGVGAPVAFYLAMGARSDRVLEELRDWMTANNTAITAVLLVVIGAKLVGDGLVVV